MTMPPPGDNKHIRYPVLFSVNVLHHYFLDSKEKVFDNLENKEKLRAFARYDVRKVLEIEPTRPTSALLSGWGMLFKKHQLGFAVLAPADGAGLVDASSKLDDNTLLQFTVKVVDPYFFQYSAAFGHVENVRVEKATQPGEQDRFFKRVYRLTNFESPQPPFIAKAPEDYDSNLEYLPESFVKYQVNGQGAFFMAKQFVPTNTAPQNVSNANWLKLESITPDNTNIHYVTTSSLKEVELGTEIPASTFALIEVQGGNTLGAFSLYDGGGNLRAPEFELRFKNRLTWWRHSLPPGITGPTTVITQQDVLPLTAQGKKKLDLNFQVDNGQGGTQSLERKDVENPVGSTAVLPEKQVDGRIKRLLSEIYL